jgi:hypothetical protein
MNCPNHINLFCTSNEGQSKNVFTLPYFLEPIGVQYEAVQSDQPIVSFCGFISHISRLLCIKELYKSSDIQTNFVIRDQFWAGKPHDASVVSEYRDNLKNSQFVLCNRGAGNWSMRFYHALEVGRIPIVINSGNIGLWTCLYRGNNKKVHQFLHPKNSTEKNWYTS